MNQQKGKKERREERRKVLTFSEMMGAIYISVPLRGYMNVGDAQNKSSGMRGRI